MNRFRFHYRMTAQDLLEQTPFHTGEWHAQDTSGSPAHKTYELLGVHSIFIVPPNLGDLVNMLNPNLPWADLHFEERISGQPLNPPPSHTQWPWASHNAQHQNDRHQFSHTYPERYWPKHAGHDRSNCPHQAEMEDHTTPEYFSGFWECHYGPQKGIRYQWGDLTDVVNLLKRSPLTRQAYLPMWFPEDTGNLNKVRVPCSLGYHFMVRGGQLHCWYYLRSCDFIRHYRDDMYLTTRLMQWICAQLNKERENPLALGTLHTTISSLHAFVGDKQTLQRLAKES